jgi:hypothetical protein
MSSKPPIAGVGVPFDITPFWDMPQLGGWVEPVGKKRKPKKDEFNIAPSFTGIITGIKLKAPLKVSKQYGVSPSQFRGLPSGKKGAYFKFTDI